MHARSVACGFFGGGEDLLGRLRLQAVAGGARASAAGDRGARDQEEHGHDDGCATGVGHARTLVTGSRGNSTLVSCSAPATTWSSAATTCGSNWVPEQRSSS